MDITYASKGNPSNTRTRRTGFTFLNRRGYAPLNICKVCGYRNECPSCSAWLVEHRSKSRLQCHHCGYNVKVPTHCPECGAEDSLVAAGPGVERIEEEVSQLFPNARTGIASAIPSLMGQH